MKNPFKKQDNTVVKAAAVIVTLSAGIVAYLYFNKYGSAIRKRFATAKKEVNEHAGDYLDIKHPKKKKHTTDLHELHVVREANN